jgi:hypothetical protein
MTKVKAQGAWEAIDLRIKEIETKGKAWEDFTQRVLVSMVQKWQESGDVKAFCIRANMVSALDLKGMRMNSMRQWLCNRGIFYNEDAKEFRYSNAKTTNAEGLKSLPHWRTATKEADFVAIDGVAEVFKLIAKLEKRQAKSQEGDTQLGEALAGLKSLTFATLAA